MPEVRFRIRWPDGAEEECYSPSTTVTEVFAADRTYALDDFLTRARGSLAKASQRVEARYGHPCASALDQLARIETRATSFSGDPGATVTCLSLTPQEARG